MKNSAIFPLLFIFGNAFADVSGVANVTDGDTLVIEDLKIRLSGIDAPESRQTCQRDDVEWLCGAESAKMLRAILVAYFCLNRVIPHAMHERGLKRKARQ